MHKKYILICLLLLKKQYADFLSMFLYTRCYTYPRNLCCTTTKTKRVKKIK